MSREEIAVPIGVIVPSTWTVGMTSLRRPRRVCVMLSAMQLSRHAWTCRH